jgi:tetratricopeptide (TPR) repeat protein
MAKPMVVTLPFVLLLLDYWPLGRLELFGADKSNNQKRPFAIDKWKNFWKLLLEKVPLFVLSAVCSAVTIVVQSSSGAVKDIEQFSLSVRMANAVVSYARYIGKMIWPADLAVFYPHPHEKIIYWQLFGAFILLVVLTFLVMRESARHKYLLTGWFWYLGTLVPVIGLVQVGGQSMANRYTYIPFVGLFIVVAWGTNELLAKWRYKKPVLALLSLAVILILAVLARSQVGYWRDSMSLFEHAIRVTEGNYVAYDGRGLIYRQKGQYDLAVSDFKKALAANPRYAPAYGNLGLVCNSTGRYDMAISCYNKAIEINPKKALAYSNRGNAYSGKGRLDLAISDYNKAIEIDPEFAEAYYNRGNAYMDKGKGQLDLAISDYDKSIEINPRDAVAYNNRGLAYLSKGNFDHAISDYNKSIEINPKYAIAYNNRANAYKSNGQFDRAVPDYNKALEINPKLVGAYLNKAGACEKAGHTREAIEAYKAFIQYAPAQHQSLVEQARQKIKELEKQN